MRRKISYLTGREKGVKGSTVLKRYCKYFFADPDCPLENIYVVHVRQLI